MSKFCSFLFMLVAFNIFANDELFNEYNFLYNDLVNFDTPGYKSSWDINNKGTNKINISQGALMKRNSDANFAITGKGFFKIRLENDMIGYTRCGDFHIGFGYSDSEFTLRMSRYGYVLYDPIIIPSNTVELLFEGNTLFALLHDGTKIEAGQLNVYDIDDEILIRYKDSIFITLDNFNGKIINDSKIHKGFIEMSNVSVIETLIRMHIILWELKNSGYNFDERDQIILMLINNIPILNELEAIKMELLNIQEILDKENKLTETEDKTVTINGQELNLLRIINNFEIKRAAYEIFRNNLLKSSIRFLKIE